MNTNEYFSPRYMDAENAITEIRRACDCSASDKLTESDVKVLLTERYELETLKSYIDIALGEIALEIEKFYKE